MNIHQIKELEGALRKIVCRPMETADVNHKWFKMLHDVLHYGTIVGAETDRTGTGTISYFGGITEVFDTEDFPLIGYKHVSAKQSFGEILAMMNGATNTDVFKTWGAGSIWDNWADEEGNLGPIYGSQWRRWKTPDGKSIDQLSNVYNDLLTNPHSRRHVVSAWNPADISRADLSPKENVAAGFMSLSPCHFAFQFGATEIGIDEGREYQERLFSAYKRALTAPVVETDELETLQRKVKQLVDHTPTVRLDMTLDLRSNDLYLGAPYNIAGYALMLKVFAECLGMVPGRLFYRVGDAHIYLNHLGAIAQVVKNYEQADRADAALLEPPLVLTPCVRNTYPWEIDPAKILVLGYQHFGIVKAPIAV